jgi:hypothetical protein
MGPPLAGHQVKVAWRARRSPPCLKLESTSWLSAPRNDRHRSSAAPFVKSVVSRSLLLIVWQDVSLFVLVICHVEQNIYQRRFLRSIHVLHILADVDRSVLFPNGFNFCVESATNQERERENKVCKKENNT